VNEVLKTQVPYKARIYSPAERYHSFKKNYVHWSQLYVLLF
jgi:hypothetical protein